MNSTAMVAPPSSLMSSWGSSNAVMWNAMTPATRDDDGPLDERPATQSPMPQQLDLCPVQRDQSRDETHGNLSLGDHGRIPTTVRARGREGTGSLAEPQSRATPKVGDGERDAEPAPGIVPSGFP